MTTQADAMRSARPPEFREVYDAHFRFVWHILTRLGVRADEVSDAAQEVFLVVHKSLPEYEPRAKMTTWLYAICAHVALARRRKRAMRDSRYDASASVIGVAAPGAIASIVLRIVPHAAGRSDAELLDLVERAQIAPPSAKTDVERRFTTEQGLAAIWLESSFTPERAEARYRRTHVTVVGRERLYHFFHTAQELNNAGVSGAAALNSLVRSIKEEE